MGVQEKLEDLFKIVDSNKIGMMTTLSSGDGLLVSRAMVSHPLVSPQSHILERNLGANAEIRLLREEKMESTWFSLPTSILAKPLNWIKIPASTSHFTTGSMYAISTRLSNYQGRMGLHKW